jgi:hypothetical protein
VLKHGSTDVSMVVGKKLRLLVRVLFIQGWDYLCRQPMLLGSVVAA